MTFVKVEYLNGYKLTWVRMPHMPWMLAEMEAHEPV